QRHFERALQIGERLAPTSASVAQFGWARRKLDLECDGARIYGARAAADLGEALESLGRHEEALEWVDRAVVTLDVSETDWGRVGLPNALMGRGGRESLAAIDGPARAIRWYTRASEAAQAAGSDAGRAYASRAECHIAGILELQGAIQDAIAHDRRGG